MGTRGMNQLVEVDPVFDRVPEKFYELHRRYFEMYDWHKQPIVGSPMLEKSTYMLRNVEVDNSKPQPVHGVYLRFDREFNRVEGTTRWKISPSSNEDAEKINAWMERNA